MTYKVKVNEYHPALQFNNFSVIPSPEFWQWAVGRSIGFNDFSITTPMKHFETSQFKHDYVVVVFTFRRRIDALCFALAEHWRMYRVWA